MVPNRQGKHAAVRHPGWPVLAFLAVIALAFGGWALLGRSGGAAVDATAGGTTAQGRGPATDRLSAPVEEKASRDTARVPGAPELRGLFPAPTTTAAATTPAATTPAATTSATGSPAAPTRPPTSAPLPPTAGTTAPAPAPVDPTMAEEVTRLSNIERAKAGCAPVKIDARLNAASLAHSKDMVDRGYFSHTSPDGKGPGDRAAAAGYPSWSGENIAAGYPTAAAVVQGWMNSPGHKANILNCQSKATGVGFDARKNMWTQMFGFV